MPLEPQNVAPPAAYALPSIPLTVGSLVSRTFVLWAHNVWQLLGFTVLVGLPLVVVLLAALFTMASGDGMRAAGPGTWIALVAFSVTAQALCWVVWAGGITHVTVQTLVVGRPAFGSVLNVGVRRALPVLGAGLLALPPILAGTALLLVPGLMVGSCLVAVVGAAVCERLGPLRALRRSWQLTAGHRRTMFWTLVVMLLIQFGLTFACLAVALLPLLGLLLYPLAILLISPLPVLWTAVAYHDLRVRQEGSGADDLARVFE